MTQPQHFDVMDFHHSQLIQTHFEVLAEPINVERDCDVVVDGPALYVHTPDFGNLYHTLFDLVILLQDTLLKDFGEEYDVNNVTLLLVHDPVISGVIRDPAGGTAPLVQSPQTAYQFLPFLAAFTRRPLQWITPVATHAALLSQKFNLKMPSEFASWITPPPGEGYHPHSSVCFKSISLNLDPSLNIWALTDDYDTAGTVAFIAEGELPHTRIYRQFFRRTLPAVFEIAQDPHLNNPPSPHAVLEAILLVRTGQDRPTLQVEDLTKLVREIAAGILAAHNVTLHLHVVDAATMNLKEQVACFCRARLLVGHHGAGLSNMVFMPLRSAVLEFRDIAGDYFRPLATVMGHHFSFVATHEPLPSLNMLHQALQDLLNRVLKK